VIGLLGKSAAPCPRTDNGRAAVAPSVPAAFRNSRRRMAFLPVRPVCARALVLDGCFSPWSASWTFSSMCAWSLVLPGQPDLFQRGFLAIDNLADELAVGGGVEIARYHVVPGHRLDHRLVLDRLLEGIVQLLHHGWIHALGPRHAERRIEHEGITQLLERGGIRPV